MPTCRGMRRRSPHCRRCSSARSRCCTMNFRSMLHSRRSSSAASCTTVVPSLNCCVPAVPGCRKTSMRFCRCRCTGDESCGAVSIRPRNWRGRWPVRWRFRCCAVCAASVQRRAANLRRAFDVTCRVSSRHTLIVDDVITTGATATQLGRALQRSGVPKVSVIVVAQA